MACAYFNLQLDGRVIIRDGVRVMLNAENVKTVNSTSCSMQFVCSPPLYWSFKFQLPNSGSP